MSDKRIIQLTETQTIAADDYVPVDGATGGTKKFLASNLGGKAEVMTEAEWEDLPDDKYTDNKVYVLTDAEPPESQLFAKVGSASLDTSADNLSDAINEHESDISTLNSKMSNYYDGSDNNLVYKASKSNGIVTMTIELRGVTASPNATITTLPQVLRPKTDTAILINVKQNYQYLGIRSNGTIYSNQALSSAFSVTVIMYETSI